MFNSGNKYLCPKQIRKPLMKVNEALTANAQYVSMTSEG